MLGHKKSVSCVSIDENGETIVSGSWDNAFLRWVAKIGMRIGDTMRGHSNAVQCVSISTSREMIVSGSLDRTAAHTGNVGQCQWQTER